jgi:hypothetical protein
MASLKKAFVSKEEIDLERAVSEAQQYLDSTDHVIIQVAEGVSRRSKSEIDKIKQDRENARKVIRENGRKVRTSHAKL